MVVFINLLDQMTTLLQIELEKEITNGIKKKLSMVENDDDAKEEDKENNPLENENASKSPCLDHLLAENIPAHILATSRMPV